MENIFKNNLKKRLTLAENIIQFMRKDILNGSLPGGAPLKQDQLAQQYGVSISALREALKILEGEGLVEFVANRGATVKKLSAQEAKEIFQVRLLLETEALYRSVDQLTEEDIKVIEQILHEEKECTEPIEYNVINARFHAALYKYCDNTHLMGMIDNLNQQVSRYMIFYLNNMSHKSDSNGEHELLLNACREKNKRLAKSILRKHMSKASDALVKYLNALNKK